MAIISTGAIYKSLVFDGESSRDYGIYITGQAVYNAPERDVEMINIPGRNGSFALDKGRFQNIEVTYPAGIFADTETDFAQGISDFRNFLCSRNGYVRLTDEYNPNEYRMAVYKSGLEVSPAQLKAGEFQLVFDCKPQRYLTSGEEPITIGEWHETETASGEIASFEAKEGDGVKSLVADIEPIQSLNGYDKPWSGGAGKNKLPFNLARIKAVNTAGTWSGNTYTHNGVSFAIDLDAGGNLTQVNLSGTSTANTTFYMYSESGATAISDLGANTACTLNGCPSGGSGTTYYLRAAIPSPWTSLATDTGSGAAFNTSSLASANMFRIIIGVDNGTNVSGKAFKPMIRLSSVSDATYEPYSNICPISGYDSVVVSRCGKNIANELHHGNISGAGAYGTGDTRVTNATSATSSTIKVTAGQYTLSAQGLDYCTALTKDNSGNIVDNFAGSWHSLPYTFTVTDEAWLYFTCRRSDNASITLADVAVQVEKGSTATSYEPYQGNTYSIDLNGTRYGGTLDVVSGVLTVTDGNIASYNGETLPSTWISDRDVYASGTTPTIGAQVVYKLATPQTVQLTAQEVELLVGTNNVWANSGDVSVEYGTAPNVLVNPTLFESSPMLEVWGRGGISINDETVVVNASPLGNVTEAGSTAPAFTATRVIPDWFVNGDVFTIAGAKFTQNTSLSDTSWFSSWMIRPRTAGTGASKYSSSYVVYLAGDDARFVFGTASTVIKTGTIDFLYKLTSDETWHTNTQTLTLTIAYDGDRTITYTGTPIDEPSGYVASSTYEIQSGTLSGFSNKVLNDPLYIDLDIGMAYKVVSSTATPYNDAVTLPPELPTLKSGVNEIAADNTVTNLKVVPRWWKI